MGVYMGRETREAFRAWRLDEIESYREDLELLGLEVDATTAASRAGCRRPVALIVLIELHCAAGHSQRRTAEILGVSQRSVQRYRSSLLRSMPWVPLRPIRTFDPPDAAKVNAYRAKKGWDPV